MSTAEANTNFFDDFLEDYFAESDEHLTVVRQNLLGLDMNVNQPSGGESVPPIAPLIEQLLRSFHSIKGLSGMVGVREAEELAHHMESYLRSLRSEQVRLTATGLDALIGGTKMLEQVIEARRSSNPAPDIGDIITQIELVLLEDSTANPPEEETTEEKPPEPTENAPPPVPLLLPSDLSEVQLNLSDEEKQRLDAAVRNGSKAWHFAFSPMPELAAKGVNVNYIRDRLQQEGELIYAAPRVKSDGGIVFDFLLGSQTPETNFAQWSGDGIIWREYKTLEALPIEPDIDSNKKTPPEKGNEDNGEKNTLPVPTPSNVVRVDLAKLDELMGMVGELVASRARLEDRLKRLEAGVSAFDLRPLREVNQKMERQLRDLRACVTRVRLVPIGEIFARMQFAVLDLARESHKKVSLTLSGQQTEIDKFVVERMMDPMLHLVRNAVSHGLETEQERRNLGKPPEGTLALRAYTVGEMVAIEIEDDGRGVDVERVAARARALGLSSSEAIAPEGKSKNVRVSEREKETISPESAVTASELLDILCAPGFSIREQADLTSGRGVGMTIVKNTVQQLGGTLTLSTRPGVGTRFLILLPLTLAIADALIVTAAGQTYAVPQSSIEGTIEIQAGACTHLENNEMIFYRGGVLPLVRLARLFNLPASQENSAAAIESPQLPSKDFNGTAAENSAEKFALVSPTPPKAERFYAFVVGVGKDALGIAVDRFIGLREIVVRPMPDPLVQVPGISGATEIGDGRVILILDVMALGKFSPTRQLFSSQIVSHSS